MVFGRWSEEMSDGGTEVPVRHSLSLMAKEIPDKRRRMAKYFWMAEEMYDERPSARR